MSSDFFCIQNTTRLCFRPPQFFYITCKYHFATKLWKLHNKDYILGFEFFLYLANILEWMEFMQSFVVSMFRHPYERTCSFIPKVWKLHNQDYVFRPQQPSSPCILAYKHKWLGQPGLANAAFAEWPSSPNCGSTVLCFRV